MFRSSYLRPVRVAPLKALFAGATLAALVVIGVLWLALREPILGVALAPADQGGFEVTAAARTDVAVGERWLALHDAHGRLPFEASLLVEEPDQLGDWAAYNAFLAAQSRIADALRSGRITLERSDGSEVVLDSGPRSLEDLPGAFWFQVGVGVLGFLLAAGVWAFRQSDRAAVFFALAGFGMLVFANAAAVYSTRELAMDGDVVWALSMANHFGAQFFTASLLALLWNYPHRLGRFPLDLLAYLIAALGWIADVAQWAPDVAFSYVVTLGLFLPSFLLAAVQWYRSRGRPVERAALKWYLLSIYLGTGLFAGVILLPSAVGVPPFASQGMMFVVFLFMFAGIALGITRYRLFELDRWWFTAWSWFLGGVAVIAVDLMLIAVLDLSQTGALTVSLAVLGWIYFPVRQWAWERIHGVAERRERLGERVQALFGAPFEERLAEIWRDSLHAEFAPLDLEPVATAVAEPVLAEHGQRMLVPHVGGDGGLRLSFPARGNRLFNRNDLATAGFLSRTAHRALEALRAREEAVKQERGRIMRDLHDDVGAKLISLVHLAAGAEPEHLARSALQDMRDVLSALDAQPCSLEEALAEWRVEAEGRAEAAGATLDWRAAVLPAIALTARERTNIARILREGVTNAIKHAAPGRLRVVVDWQRPCLRLAIADDGGGEPSAWTAGRGTRVVRTRAADLGGSASWVRSDLGGAELRVEVALAEGG